MKKFFLGAVLIPASFSLVTLAHAGERHRCQHHDMAQCHKHCAQHSHHKCCKKHGSMSYAATGNDGNTELKGPVRDAAEPSEPVHHTQLHDDSEDDSGPHYDDGNPAPRHDNDDIDIDI